MSNRLADSNSPYLLQHADNPVDWWPWGPEALRLARELDRPILLSIGYSACHWCHVMAHESFESAAVAEVMNRDFVSVKVDREERPDVDAAYMEAVQAMTGHGGWPLTAFLTTEGLPFYGGTYFPPSPRGGMTGFPQLLEAIAEAWRGRRAEVEDSAARLAEALRAASRRPGPGPVPQRADLGRAVAAILAHEDRAHGGFGGAPKFPQAPTLALLARWAALAPEEPTGREALAAVDRALSGMAGGGLFDQLGGGFHRYCVDADWTVPHFEKMLYDQALLVPLFVDQALRGGGPRAGQVVEATLGYLEREMRHPGGAFLAAQDADQEGQEGRYFLWTPEELRAALGPSDGAWAADLLGVRDGGEPELGASVLTLRRPPAAGDEARWQGVRDRLLGHRDARIKPGVDDKVVCGWNGLTILAFADAGRRLDRRDWVQVASEAAAFVLGRVRTPAGGLAHAWRAERVTVPAFLDDIAAMALACQALAAADRGPTWTFEARRLVDRMVAEFRDPETGRFHRASAGHEALYLRQVDAIDGPTPSGTALALRAMIGDDRLGREASSREPILRESLGFDAAMLAQAPSAFAGLLDAAGLWYLVGR